MNICFVHMLNIESQQHLEFLGNILIRTSEVLGEGAEIHFIYSGKVGSSYLEGKGVILHPTVLRYHRLGSHVINPALMMLKTLSICRKKEIDIVLNLSEHYSFFLVCLAAKIAGCKCIARIAGLVPQARDCSVRKKFFKRLGWVCERVSLASADRVLCLSDSLKDLLVQRGNNPEKISVISQGVSLGLFPVRDLSDVVKRPKRLLFVGRIVKSKGVEDCIKVFLRLKKNFPDIELVVCGNGSDKPMLLKKYGNERGLIFKGFVHRSKLSDIYSSSDILLLPSYSEGMPNVVLEAMACRLPVVASETGEIPHLLGNGKGALIFPGDLDELLAAVKTMIVDEKFRINAVQSAYSYIVANHSYEAVRNLTLELFKFQRR